MSSYPVTTTSSGAWRFTALLGAVAFVLCAGIVSWMIITIADLRSGAPGLSVDLSVPPERAQPSVLGNEFGHDLAKDLVAKDLAAGEPERSGLGISGRESDLSWLGKNSFQAQGFLNMTVPFELQSTNQRVAAPAKSPSDAQSDPPGPQVASIAPETSTASITPDAPAVASITPDAAAAPYVSAEHPRHAAPDQRFEPSRAAMPKAHKTAPRPYYMEKLVEQGDAGDVTFRYRRRNCTPSNMVDVCYMPLENRRGIVVEHW
jgi:hypothetical protein